MHNEWFRGCSNTYLRNTINQITSIRIFSERINNVPEDNSHEWHGDPVSKRPDRADDHQEDIQGISQGEELIEWNGGSDLFLLVTTTTTTTIAAITRRSGRRLLHLCILVLRLAVHVSTQLERAWNLLNKECSSYS